MTRTSRTGRIVLFWAAAAVIAALSSVLTAARLVGGVSPRVFRSIESVPSREVGLLLGASEYFFGHPNPVLAGRIRAAAALYHAGKVRKLVVSGISRPDDFYDEAAAMKKGLIGLGVPEEDIIVDGRSFRTLDSVLRMRDVFGYDDFIAISQRDHCERALYLADHNGIAAVGFAAEIMPGMYASERAFSAVREPLARVKAVLDVAIGRRATCPTGR